MSLLQLLEASFGEAGAATTPILDLTVYAGEIVLQPMTVPERGVLWARGCVGLIPAVSGQVMLFGEDVWPKAHEDLVHLRQRASVASVALPLLSNLTVRENVALPLLMRGQDRAFLFPTVDGLLHRLGLEQHAGHRPEEIPARSLALAVLARAVAVPADLVILDSPPPLPEVRGLLRDLVGRGAGVLVFSPRDDSFPEATRVMPAL